MAYQISIEQTKNSRIDEIDFADLPFGRHFSDHMFVCDFYDGAWRDARIIPFQDFSLHPATSALHYGQAIFEGLKAQVNEEGVPVVFRPDKNIERMNLSAARMAMPAFPVDLFFQALETLLSIDASWIPQSPDSSMYIRPFMFATEKYVGIKVAENYRFAIFTCPVGKYYSKPVKVYIHDVYVRAFPGGTGFAKAAGNYGAALMPAKEIQALGYDQILWLDGIHHKYLQEIGTMNVFVVIDGVLITPPLTEGTILNGITRDSVIALAKDMGYKLQERDISVDEVCRAFDQGLLEDAFGAGTAAGVAPIGEMFYKGKSMIVPESVPGKMSYELKKKLQQIKSGEVKDTFGWLKEIKIR